MTKTENRITAKEVLKVCKWAKNNGALRIRAFGVDILFPPPDLDNPALAPAARHEARHTARHTPMATASRDLPPNLEYLRDAVSPADPSQKPIPAVRSEEDDPDLFARDSDIWASQTRLPRR